MGGVSLTEGPLPVVVLVVAALATVALVAWVLRGRSRVTALVVAAVLGVVTFFVLNPLVVGLLELSSDPLPGEVTAWLSVGVGTLVLTVAGLAAPSARRKATALVSGLLMLLGIGSEVNSYFDYYGNVATLFGDDTGIGGVSAAGRASAPEQSPATARWTGDAPGPGRVETASIPAPASGFVARPAYVYLPPAYEATNPPRLPVLILVSGQPGGPADWVNSGQLQMLMDTFAAQHRGLAPVTVVVDPNGSDDGNTMCMDSQIAKVDTYLTQDVPAWITSELGVDTNHARWAFGGWSFGGTCAIQMGTRHADLFPNVIDVDGEREPAISPDRAQTIQQAFGDSPTATATFTALTPLTLLGERRYTGSAGFFAAGGADPPFLAALTEVSTAARNAGMAVQTQVVPDQGHSWAVPIATLVPALDWLAPRMGFA